MAKQPGCQHTSGTYPAEIVYEGDKPVYQHYRCRDCTIIIKTERL